MTRETKIGLVVAGSFLCLVCIVVASKMNGGADGSEVQEQPPTTPNTIAALTPPQQGNPKPNGEKLPQSVPAPPARTRENSTAPSFASVPPGTAIPAPVKSSEQKQKELEDKIQRQKKETDKPAAVPSLVVANPTADPTSIPMPPGTVPDIKAPLFPITGTQPSNPPGAVAVPGLTPPAPNVNVFSNTEPALAPPPQVLPPKQVDLPPPLPVAPQGSVPNPAKGLDPLPLPANPPLQFKDSFPTPKEGPPAALPKDTQAPFGPPPDPPAPIAPPAALPAPIGLNSPSAPSGPPPTGLNPPSPVPSLPQTGLSQPSPVPSLPQANVNPAGPVPPLPREGANPLAPAQPPLGPPPSMTPPAQIPSIGMTPLPSTPPIQVPPPGAVTPIPTMPPLAPGGFNSSPPVKMIEPDVARVAPGETSFAQLSMRLYRDPKYATALQAFNRDHFQALADGKALAVDQPVLNPNQQVLHPPVGILERDYARLIGSAPAAVIPAASPLPAVRATPVVPSAPPVTTLPAGARVYVVQTAGGERIRDIAQRMLGNADRWTDIYRLNPTLQPQFAIPQGTQLQLP